MNIITDEISYVEDGEMVYIRQGYIIKKGEVKIFPFVLEDLSKSYNLTRFPDRPRRNPKILRKYNFFGNINIVTGYKYVEVSEFAKKSPIYIAMKINKDIDIPEETIKTKMSQLKAYIKKGEKTCSYGLIKTYLNFKNVPYEELERIISGSHRNLYEMRNAFEELLRWYPSEYKYKLD